MRLRTGGASPPWREAVTADAVEMPSVMATRMSCLKVIVRLILERRTKLSNVRFMALFVISVSVREPIRTEPLVAMLTTLRTYQILALSRALLRTYHENVSLVALRYFLAVPVGWYPPLPSASHTNAKLTKMPKQAR